MREVFQYPPHAVIVRLSDGIRSAFDAVHRLMGTSRAVRPVFYDGAVSGTISASLSDVAVQM